MMTIKQLSLILVSIIAVSSCERVTEYKCTAEQIEKARVKFEWCKAGMDLGVNSKSPHQCWDEATRAHCEVAREFQRAGVDMNAIKQTEGN